MSPGAPVPGAEAIELLFSWAVTTALSFAVVILDERRLKDEQLERAWPAATRAVALVYLGVLALPFHFARTRGELGSARGALRMAYGLVLGLVVALAVGLVAGVLDAALAWALGLPD